MINDKQETAERSKSNLIPGFYLRATVAGTDVCKSGKKSHVAALQQLLLNGVRVKHFVMQSGHWNVPNAVGGAVSIR